MTKEQIKNILECVNYHENNFVEHKIYTEKDIKHDKPLKPIVCYVIAENYSNPNSPHIYYGEYNGNTFLSHHVSNPNIISHEEWDVLGYIAY